MLSKRVTGNRDGPLISDGITIWKGVSEDSPAIESAKWRRDGEMHRVDGAAIEYADGDKEWDYCIMRIGPTVNYADGSKPTSPSW